MTRIMLILLALPLISLFAETQGIGDNCCHLPGRHCQSDSEWQQGYHDFVNNQCEPSAAAGQSETTEQPTPTPAPAPADDGQDTQDEPNNCCFIAWSCTDRDEWISGYYARLAGNSCTTESQQSYSPTAQQRAEARARQSAPDAEPTAIHYTTPVEIGGVIIRRPTEEELQDALCRTFPETYCPETLE